MISETGTLPPPLSEEEIARRAMARLKDISGRLMKERTKLREQKEDSWQRRAKILAISGFPVAKSEREVELIEQTLFQATYVSPSQGIA